MEVGPGGVYGRHVASHVMVGAPGTDHVPSRLQHMGEHPATGFSLRQSRAM